MMGSIKKRGNPNDSSFIDILFSWSLENISDKDLYKNQVEKISDSFQSVENYFGAYIYPLLEETRAQLSSSMENISRAPFAEVIAFDESKPYGTLLYDVKVDYWKNRFSDRGKEPYKTLPGDVFVLADAKPESESDLQRVGRTWTFASVTKIADNEEDDSSSIYFKVKTSKDIGINDGMLKSLYVVFLINITTNKRIWNALHMFGNRKIIKEVLCTDYAAEENSCPCSVQSNSILDEKIGLRLSSELNESQSEAILSCLHKMQCDHKSAVELIWGPPGTGKTKTVSMLLFYLLRIRCRTLTCTPTNVAVTEVASRVLKLVRESFETNSGIDASFCSLGDILLFGNKERLKVGSDIEEIYLDFRMKRLAECFGPLTGWCHCFTSMIDLLEECVSQYHIFLDNELNKEMECGSKNEIEEKGRSTETQQFKSFLLFVRERFKSTELPLKRCIYNLCTHIPISYILEHNFQNIISLVSLIDSLKTLLFCDNVISEDLEEIFSCPEEVVVSSQSFVYSSSMLHLSRIECLSLLRTVLSSLKELNFPSVMNMGSIKDFCFQTASLIFCTASSSYKLHSVGIEPLKLLVIDEAGQLKECESAIPLQLPGLRHAVLIGDECQLPAMVESKVSGEAGFGRSLFERLSSLGHPRHLLNIQYRMHPSISFFPNSTFYVNRILDGPNVKRRSYEKNYLPGPMFGPYSFINIIDGREEKDDIEHSRRNLVEVAVVLKLVRSLYKEWCGSKQKLSVGVISPYAAQVVAIKEKLGQKYENFEGFAVKVKSIDGFQGGEEDIIIFSTVRSNSGGSIGFMSNPQRTNVALTRARHCLWILGNEKTLSNSESVWVKLVRDAIERQCIFNADEDKELAKAILEVKKEFDQLDDLLNGDSSLFRSTRWKVLFSDNFRKSFGKLRSMRIKTSVMNVLLKLAGGWRPKKRNVDSVFESSSQILKQFKVEGLYIVCTIDIKKELMYTQVLKVWDILPLEDIPKLVKRLDCIFERYTDDFISRCKEKCLEGDLEVPKTWLTTFDVVQYKSLDNNKTGTSSSAGASDSRCYVENSKVSESLLLMKFYSLSSGIVSHLLSDHAGKELELPFEVTDQELEIILFPRSTFILGRSGTGKTTVLTMKLFQKERLHHIATQGFSQGNSNNPTDVSQRINVEDSDEGAKKITFLRQLFVTVSPKLCFAVKQQVSELKSSAFGGSYSAESSSIGVDDIDDMAQFKTIPDSFVDIPQNAFPLVITFHKFLMMLDGTLGNSYFDRFPDAREFLHEKAGVSRSVGLQTFIRTKEVNYDRFCSFYWPHFNSQLINKVDSSRAFTEIISHIKGGLGAGEACDGRLSREDYVILSDSRISTLNRQKREIIYDIFQDYEKMKTEKGEYDLADLAMDLHRRFKDFKYEGDEVDFVYIDEVQDLTMRQIELFKHICKNVVEGFVFSGDTAQTIARGIDFRFEDIRSLFFNKFILQSRSEGNDEKREKGQISKIFNLSQNFRTHAGVLKLAQSVIDLLYRFFPLFIDVLSPETSLICGEAPILLESGNDENAIVTIFANNGNVGGNMVGFGAEQVILVRDDSARKDISEHVGKQALVLTIVECKGLEFQDVLLYNFFGSSRFKNQWRVIYEYMKEQDLLGACSPKYPTFNEAKHNVLCSELKQLYVAITRTRQRLWICENIEELSKPMFDYWKKLGLVQVRKLDDSLAQAMQVASSPDEWKSRGFKLLREGNYEMATMCFERAGDTYGEKLAKAAGLKAAADHMHGSNPETACNYRRQAAEIFDSIGKADYAAECFYMLREYERAGRIYMEKCAQPEFEKAGECFSLAGCYELAAEVYAQGNFFSKCLSVCTKGKCFDIGLKYVQYWKQHSTEGNGMIRRGEEIEKIEQEFLESCALHYHELNDHRSMMKFVKSFCSMDAKRTFLRTLDCLDELLSLEEESGNFLEAANIAKQRGNLLLAADLLGKAGLFKEASLLILWYVLANSLWANGSKGWPLKQFTQEKELVTKAESFAKEESKQFYEFVCTEFNILSSTNSSLFQMKQHLSASQRHKSLRGEILSVRKILDAHLDSSISKYEWEDELVIDLIKHAESKILKNQVTVETLVHFWSFWKNKIVHIFECLQSLETQDISEYWSYGEFCLNYLGVWKQINNLNPVYLLIYSNADWVRELDDRSIRRRGKLVSIEAHQFVTAARTYWGSELLSVGLKVLDKLEALRKLSNNYSSSIFCQSRCLTHIYEVAKFLLDSKFLDSRYHTKTLQKFVRMSYEPFFGNLFLQDWRNSMKENMVSLRLTEVSRNLLVEVIYDDISTSKKKLTYGQMGRVAMMILGSGTQNNELFGKIAESFGWNQAWKLFIEDLSRNSGPDFPQASLIQNFHKALDDTYKINWRNQYDYISPDCFLYLLERLLILVSHFQGFFITTKSSFLEWFIHREENMNPTSNFVVDMHQSFGGTLDFLVFIVREFLYNKQDTMEWVKNSNLNVSVYYSLLVLRLVVLVCLLRANFGKCFDLLYDLLGRRYISAHLPPEFYYSLRRIFKFNDVRVHVKLIAEVCKMIDNPLVIVSLGKDCSEFFCRDALFVDLKASHCREDILKVMFPKAVKASQDQTGAVEAEATVSNNYEKSEIRPVGEASETSSSIILSGERDEKDGGSNAEKNKNSDKEKTNTMQSGAQGNSGEAENSKGKGKSKAKKGKTGSSIILSGEGDEKDGGSKAEKNKNSDKEKTNTMQSGAQSNSGEAENSKGKGKSKAKKGKKGKGGKRK